MCQTHTVRFECAHTTVHAVRANMCAIGLTHGLSADCDMPHTPDVTVRHHCWAAPQGGVSIAGFCGACNFRLDKYGTIDPVEVTWMQVREAAANIQARREAREAEKMNKE